VAGVDEFQISLIVENAEKQRSVATHFRVPAQKPIYVIDYQGRFSAETHA
jgi:hypothetical protein